MPTSEARPESASGWNLYEIAACEDPHSRWREIREKTPVLDAGGGVFFVSRWDLVDLVLRDARHGAGAGVSASFGATGGRALDAMRAWLMSLDGPEQTRARGLVRRAFTPRAVEALRPFVTREVERLVGRIETRPEGSTLDLIEELAFPLPSEVIRSLFEIEAEQWRREVVPIVKGEGNRPGDGIAMIEGLVGYFESRLDAAPHATGLLGRLSVPDPELGALSRLEVVANAVLLVTAAIDTTTGLIGNTLQCLLERPSLLAQVRDQPALVAAAVEETLRFEPPALSCSRTAGVPLELAGVTIPEGSQLLLGLAPANRDPERHVDPDTFRLDRDATGVLTFGGGRHFCLGAGLARMEATLAVERLLVQAKVDLELEREANAGPHWQLRNPTVRALERLPVRIRKAMEP